MTTAIYTTTPCETVKTTRYLLIVLLSILLPISACGSGNTNSTTEQRTADPSIKPQSSSQSTDQLPVRYQQEPLEARNDLSETLDLTQEHGLSWYRYAPTDDGGIRVFFAASTTCAYRLIVRETSQYVGVRLVEGSTADRTCTFDRTGATFDSMHATLRRPIGDRIAVELGDLVFWATNPPDTLTDAPKLTHLATDVSSIPEVIVLQQPDDDMIIINGTVYAHVDWADKTVDNSTDAIAKLTHIGEIGRQLNGKNGVLTLEGDLYLRDWDATVLEAGTPVYADPTQPSLVFTMEANATASGEYDGLRLRGYMAMVEG